MKYLQLYESFFKNEPPKRKKNLDLMSLIDSSNIRQFKRQYLKYSRSLEATLELIDHIIYNDQNSEILLFLIHHNRYKIKEHIENIINRILNNNLQNEDKILYSILTTPPFLDYIDIDNVDELSLNKEELEKISIEYNTFLLKEKNLWDDNLSYEDNIYNAIQNDANIYKSLKNIQNIDTDISSISDLNII